MNKQLSDFIEKSLRRGVSEEEVLSGLLVQGWDKKESEESLARIKEMIRQESLVPLATPSAPKKGDWDIDLKTLSAPEILLYLGGLIICLAGITYVAMNWAQWNSPVRILAILLPMLVVYGIGAFLWFGGKYQKPALAFLVTGSLLFPLFLTVTLKELGIFQEPYGNNFGFSVFLTSLGFYFLSGLVFRNAVWSFLCPASGLIAYYYFLKILGLNDLLFENAAMTWAFLIPAVLYIFLGYRFEKSSKRDFSRYPYLLGFLTLFLSLQRLALNGDLLKTFIGNICVEDTYRYAVGCDWQSIGGWSIVITGMLYLLIAYVVRKSKEYGLEEPARYEKFFNFFGPLMLLGGLFYLGSGGREPVYETLLLFSSLGFIFGSIINKSRQFLYLGTIFLIIYIFGIGAEYFESNVGWPITLFVAGLASMGIGFGIEKLRRKYFTT